MKSLSVASHLEIISSPFKGILLDAYGVFWDGSTSALFPGASEVMARLVSAGKTVGILTNASALAEKEIAKLSKHGLQQGVHYHFLLTSGEITRQALLHEQLPFSTPSKTFWILGTPHPRFASPQPLFAGSNYREVQKPEEADFIYIDIPHINGEDQDDVSCFRPAIEQLFPLKLPMVCTNPDKFVHESSSTRLVVRQGSLAAIYEELGGTVVYFGKPSPLSYSAAMLKFFEHQQLLPNEVLMVGDTPETDICGANRSGLSSALLLKTGITAHRIALQGEQVTIQSLSSEEIPTFFIERFAP